MASKDEQVEALIAFLDSPRNDERTTREVAEFIVEDFYRLLLKPLGDAPVPIHPGQPWKDVLSGKIKHIAWTDGTLYWVVSSDSRMGYLGPVGPWAPYAAKTTGKPLEPVNADGWKPADKVGWIRKGWGGDSFSVLAVIEKAVLLQPDAGGRPLVEPNDLMARFYKKKRAPMAGLFSDGE